MHKPTARKITPKMPTSATTSFKFIDLFAGVGGMRLAFEQVGGNCVFSSEWDKYSQQTYACNFGETPHGDITQIQETEIPNFDVLVAGFPCQPFSTIGKRQGFSHPTQGTLFHDVVRIMRHKRNKSFLLENVVGLQSHGNGDTFEIIKNSLTELGFRWDYKVLDAAVRMASRSGKINRAKTSRI